MRRRDFFTTSSALAYATSKRIAITAIEFWRFDGHRDATAGTDRQYQVNPLHLYDELRPKPYRDGAPSKQRSAVSSIYLQIQAGDAFGWYGPIDREAAIVVENQLRTFLIGKDAMAIETLWDQMHRLNRHSRRGHFMMAISAIDNALWALANQSCRLRKLPWLFG
jgi:L-rhamnonate dehydratase